MMQILVYDDLPNIAKSLANKIRNAYDDANVTVVDRSKFQDLMEEVNNRIAALMRDRNEASLIEPTDVDRADLVVVDYDLLRYSEAGDTTGSRLAYLLRCFTECGLIVVLNEYGTNTFDMSLRSPTQDFADLHLGAAQIGNPGLWSGSFEGYRPWHWPVLPDAREKFEKCVEDVRENLDRAILDFLGLSRVIDWMPKRAHEFFLGSGDMETVRFEAFVKQARAGIDSKDELSSECMARVAAARIVALLNGVILPEQSLLVDAPHLVSRFPSLIGDEGQDIHHWNRLCDPLDEEVDGLLKASLTEQRFKKQHWLWRPAWYWPDIARDERIAEVRDPWRIVEIDWVFCENVSRFVPAEYADDFRADVPPPFSKRYILRRNVPETVKLVSQIGSKGTQDPLVVDYVPQAAFSV